MAVITYNKVSTAVIIYNKGLLGNMNIMVFGKTWTFESSLQ